MRVASGTETHTEKEVVTGKIEEMIVTPSKEDTISDVGIPSHERTPFNDDEGFSMRFWNPVTEELE